MASREFLKILSYARLGDVSAQQKLASAYLGGLFNTPIQPSNALIWLEKAYFSSQNQALSDEGLSKLQLTQLFAQIAQVPLVETFSSPAFPFGWDSFWRIARSDEHPEAQAAAKWQLIHLILNPLHAETQSQLIERLKKKDLAVSVSELATLDFSGLQKIVLQYLQEFADKESAYTRDAKELLIKLQPKNESLASLWNAWIENHHEEALIQAAELGLTEAKLTHGLRLAQLDGDMTAKKATDIKSNASLKKAAYWLELAAKDGHRDAWYTLGEIYRRPQFSGYNAAESDRCFDRAADLGHAQAQLRKGASLWRKREKIEEKVRGLQASYWVWQANQQGVPEAKELLSKILESCPYPKQNEWYVLALCAEQALNHHAEHKLDVDWMLLCHRLIIANQFNFSKAELLLTEVGQLQHEHCVVVDIRWELPKILPRLIQIETIQQRRVLLAAGKAFAGTESDLEGNLRQRRYRFDRVIEWLSETFTAQTETKVAKAA